MSRLAGATGGSTRGGPGMDMKTSSMIGFERRHNPAPALEDEDEFVERAGRPRPPAADFRAIVELNRGPLLTDALEPPPLAPRQVEQRGPAADAGRRPDRAAVRRRPDPGFRVDPDAQRRLLLQARLARRPVEEIVFVGCDDEDGRQAGRLAVAGGTRRLAGFLDGA